MCFQILQLKGLTMNLQYLIIGVLAFLMSCGLIPLPQAAAQGELLTNTIKLAEQPPAAIPDEVKADAPTSLDFNKLMIQFLNVCLNFLFQAGIPALLVAWVLDFLVKLIPPLKPFRDAVYTFITTKIDQWAAQQARRAVLAHGQVFKNELAEMQNLRLNVPDNEIQRLKNERYDAVLNELIGRGVAKNVHHAARLLEGAIGELKAEKVNP
jgi:hypothetical protein